MLNIKQIRKKFLFYETINNNTEYYCQCGENFTIEKSASDYDEVLPQSNDEDDEMLEIYKQIELSQFKESVCPNCKLNFSSLSNQKKLFHINQYFITDFDFEDKTDNLFIYFNKYKVIKKNNRLHLEKRNRYIRLHKNSKKIYYKDFEDINDKEFDLDKINETIEKFFNEKIKIIYNIINLHIYISLLATHVSDAQNIDIISSLLSEIKNRENFAGITTFKKIFAIFFGIIKYSNLSTIAITKGSKFLYDLMLECNIPNSKTMQKANVTSPIKIFNYLIKIYINKINDEVNEEDVEKLDFVYKSNKMIVEENNDISIKELKEEKQLNINTKLIKNYTTKVKKNNRNNYEVISVYEDASASKFIFKKIKNFSDFKQILKFFKFYNKQEIIALLQKYELEFLINVIDIIYFRDKMDNRELSQVFSIILDFVKEKSLLLVPRLKKEDIVINYKYVEEFDFTFYDDSVMMMEVLEFDPKREFNKIKTYDKLLEYHDNLVKYFNVVSDKEKNAKFIDFVDRFRFLENRDDYNGNLRIKLIDTPAMLIQEGIEMKHSASSYSKKVINNIYLIGQVFDETPGLSEEELKRFTIGFNFSKLNGLEFHQVKGFANQSGSDEFKKRLIDFLKIKDVSFKPVKDLKILNSN